MQYTTRPQQVVTHDSRYDHNHNQPDNSRYQFHQFLHSWAEHNATVAGKVSEPVTADATEQELSGWENEGGAL